MANGQVGPYKWEWFHRCMHLSKFSNLNILNMSNLLCVDFCLSSAVKSCFHISQKEMNTHLKFAVDTNNNKKKPQNKNKTQLVGDWVSLENAPFKPSLLCSCLMHLVQQLGGAWLPTHRPLPCNGSDFAFCFSFHLDIGIEAEVYDWRPSSGWASCRLANCTPFTGAENVPVTLKAARCVALIYRVTVMSPQHSPWSQGKILDSIQHWSWGSFRKSWFRLSST